MSKDLEYEINLSTNKDLENSIRESVSKWSNRIPNHPYKNLGNKITINEIWYKPAYYILLQSQYEERSKHKGDEPYTGQNIPPKKYENLSDFNSWDLFLGEIKEFTNEIKDLYVDGSQYVKTCHICHGSGKSSCGGCNGKGRVMCPRCSGTGKQNCHVCGGSGKAYKQISESRQVWVPATNSYAGHYKTETYSKTVLLTCDYCSGKGKETCGTCRGTKTIVCSRCHGSGSVTCVKCKGECRLMHYFYVTRKLECTEKDIYIIHTEVYNSFPEFIDECSNYESYNVLTSRNKKLNLNQLDSGHFLNEDINTFISESLSEASSFHVMIFQQLDLSCIDNWEILYSFKGKDYKMCLTGSDYEVIPGLSPIYEIAFEYWKKSVNAYKMFRYSRSAQLFNKVKRFEVFEINKLIVESLDSVNTKINQSYALGTFIASWLIAFFGSFIVYQYASKVNYVFSYTGFINNPDNFLYSYHPWTLVLVFLILAYITTILSKTILQSIGHRIPSLILRIITGMVITTICFIILLTLLALFNASGITVVLTFTFWLIIKILKIVFFIIWSIIGIIVLIAKAVWFILIWIFGLFT